MTDLLKISELFNIQYGNSLELINLEQTSCNDETAIPYVSRTANNNGVSAFVKGNTDIKKNPAHTLSVAVSGSVLETFYQPLKYYTGFHILILSPKRETSVVEMLFYAHCIKHNKFKYSYGRQANKTLKNIEIPSKIPNNLKNHLKVFFKQQLNNISNNTSNQAVINKKTSLNINTWQSFKLTNLFEIKGSKTTSLLQLQEHGKGEFPYVTTQATNNGIAGFYDFNTEDGNVLTVDSAVVGYCSYQELAFSASDHVEKLIPKFKMNKFTAMFFVTILNLEKYRYNYGRKCSQNRMKTTNIKLPEKDGKPDFEFMENYIKSLQYSVSI